ASLSFSWAMWPNWLIRDSPDERELVSTFGGFERTPLVLLLVSVEPEPLLGPMPGRSEIMLCSSWGVIGWDGWRRQAKANATPPGPVASAIAERRHRSSGAPRRAPTHARGRLARGGAVLASPPTMDLDREPLRPLPATPEPEADDSPLGLVGGLRGD